MTLYLQMCQKSRPIFASVASGFQVSAFPVGSESAGQQASQQVSSTTQSFIQTDKQENSHPAQAGSGRSFRPGVESREVLCKEQGDHQAGSPPGESALDHLPSLLFSFFIFLFFLIYPYSV